MEPDRRRLPSRGAAASAASRQPRHRQPNSRRRRRWPPWSRCPGSPAARRALAEDDGRDVGVDALKGAELSSRALAASCEAASASTVAVSPTSQRETAHGHGYPRSGSPTATGSGTASGRCGASRGSHRASFLACPIAPRWRDTSSRRPTGSRTRSSRREKLKSQPGPLGELSGDQASHQSRVDRRAGFCHACDGQRRSRFRPGSGRRAVTVIRVHDHRVWRADFSPGAEVRGAAQFWSLKMTFPGLLSW